jgi:hypothetical protein
MTTVTTTELAPDNTRRLIELARAFKAIGSPGHQHHACRIVDVTSASQLSAPLRIGALPDRLLLEGRAPGRRAERDCRAGRPDHPRQRSTDAVVN